MNTALLDIRDLTVHFDTPEGTAQAVVAASLSVAGGETLGLVAEPLVTHQGLPRRDAMAKSVRWLDRVRIPDGKRRLHAYPHELSGGMRRRVVIAMAMICRPRLLIADESTTALDVSTQRQILALMAGLKTELETAMLLITHDLGVVAQTAGRVAVMYAGRVVELAGIQALFDNPLHPYTQGLLRAVPRLGRGSGPLYEIAGIPIPAHW